MAGVYFAEGGERSSNKNTRARPPSCLLPQNIFAIFWAPVYKAFEPTSDLAGGAYSAPLDAMVRKRKFATPRAKTPPRYWPSVSIWQMWISVDFSEKFRPLHPFKINFDWRHWRLTSDSCINQPQIRLVYAGLLTYLLLCEEVCENVIAIFSLRASWVRKDAVDDNFACLLHAGSVTNGLEGSAERLPRAVKPRLHQSDRPGPHPRGLPVVQGTLWLVQVRAGVQAGLPRPGTEMFRLRRRTAGPLPTPRGGLTWILLLYYRHMYTPCQRVQIKKESTIFAIYLWQT